MGLKDWVLGWTSASPFLAAAEVASSEKQRPGVQVEPVDMPLDFELLVKGTSFRQAEVKKLGLGPRKFMLAPEINNREDTNAVMVFGLIGEEPFHVGYLPRDKETTIAAHQLGLLMLNKGLAMQVEGDVLKGDTHLIVQIGMPALTFMSHLATEYS